MKLINNYNITLLTTLFCYVLSEKDGDNYLLEFLSTDFNRELVNKDIFIFYYTPWCDLCTTIYPTWNKLANKIFGEDNALDQLQNVGDQLTMVRMDCTKTANVRTCSEHDVTGYPTLSYYKKGDAKGKVYKNTMDIPSLLTFMQNMLLNISPIHEDALVPVTQYGLTELTDACYDKYLSTGNHFVFFYAPWSKQCQEMASTWADLAQHYIDNDTISIDKIDCMNNDACKDFKVLHYPTMLLIINGQVAGECSSERKLQFFKDFVELRSKNPEYDPKRTTNDTKQGPVLDIDLDNYDECMKKDLVFVKYYAPWCGHCKHMTPTWQELGQRFSEDDRIVVARADCSRYPKICQQQNIEQFPTVLLYRKGKVINEYNGSRSFEHMTEFLEKHVKENKNAKKHDEL